MFLEMDMAGGVNVAVFFFSSEFLKDFLKGFYEKKDNMKRFMF